MADDGSENTPWRRNLYVLWAAETLSLIGFSLCYPFLPFYLAELGARSFESQALWAGAMSASTSACLALTAPLWGLAADRVGRKPMIVRAMACGTITTGLMSVVVAPWQLLILFGLEGALTATIAAAMTLVASTTPRAQLGYALGLLQTAIFTGSSIGPLIGGLLADRIGFRPVFGLGSLLLVVATALTATLVREVVVRQPQEEAGSGQRSRDRALLTLLLAGALPAAVGIMFALRLATSMAAPILPLYVERLAAAGAPLASLTGLAFGAFGVGSAGAALTLGRLADRWGHRRMLIVAGVAVAALFLPLALVRQPWELIVCYGLLGIASGGIVPSAQAVVAELTPPARHGLVFGVTNAAASVGGFAGPFAGSLLAAQADVRLIFLVSGTMMVGFVAWLIRALLVRSMARVASMVGS